MKEVKKEVVVEQTAYELTKEELEQIRRDARLQGRKDVIGYISFAAKYYRYQINIGGAVRFVGEVIDFISGDSNIIDNIYNYSFEDYVRTYRKV